MHRSNNDWGYKFAAYPTVSQEQEPLYDQLLAQCLDTETAHVIFESKHNYDDNTDETFEVNFAGAEAIGVVFSSETSTETQHDYLQFLRGSDGDSGFYGDERYSGGRNNQPKHFPGIETTKPLIIPASQFWVRFQSDRFVSRSFSHNNWIIIKEIIVFVQLQ